MDTYDVLLGMIGKIIKNVYKMETNDSYYQLYRVEFSDGSIATLESFDHHSYEGFLAEWIIKK